jgi:hypothetical protein
VLKIQKLVPCLLLILGLAGCASLSKQECLNADWQIIGYEDGAGGQPPNRIGAHRKACADHGVVPVKADYDQGYYEGLRTYCTYNRGLEAGRYGHDENAVCAREGEYLAGRETGLRSYCTFDGGYELALGGNDFNRVCPAGLAADFAAGYDHGAKIYNLESRLAAIEERLDEIGKERNANDNRRQEIKQDIAYNTELSGADRASLLQELDALRADTHDLDDEADSLDTEEILVRLELARQGHF